MTKKTQTITIQTGDKLVITVQDGSHAGNNGNGSGSGDSGNGGGTPSNPPGPDDSNSGSGPAPDQPAGVVLFAPYADMGLWPTPFISNFLQQTGADRITLAFVTARGQEAYWFGIQPPDWPELVSQVKAVGANKVVASFGGANGQELAWAITDDDALFAQYKKILDIYGFDMIDFDIEGAAIGMFDSVQRRNRVIARLNAAYPNLQINYCLPVMPDGLTADGVKLIKDAKAKGCQIHYVNLMVMDYGQYNQSMGQAAISALKATKTQVEAAGLNVAGYGATPMIGRNDTGEIFTLDNARELYAFAKTNASWVKMLSYWSCARDNGVPGPLYQASNVVQSPFQFAKILTGKQQ